MDTNNFNTTSTVKTTKRVFKQLTQLDRSKIEDIIKESKKKDYTGPKVTCQYLADVIRVSKSTISRELKRGEMEKLNNKGHWEGDLIVGARGAKKDCLLTLYERVGSFEYAMKIPNKKMESVVQVLDKLERKLGTEAFKKIFKSITFDNGIEFSDCEGMERSIDINTKRTEIYYADPYCSWERGGNKRGNRMLRKFFPKKTDFSEIKSYNIYLALCNINYSIRKSLGGTSSLELIKNLKDDVYSIFEKI